MHYIRQNETNLFQIGGNTETVHLGNIEDRAPHHILTHAEAINLAGWLLGTVLLQSDEDAATLDRFRSTVAAASGRRLPFLILVAEGKCESHGCAAMATVRFTWPGRDEQRSCLEHGLHAKGIAAAMGLHLQIIPILSVTSASFPDAHE